MSAEIHTAPHCPSSRPASTATSIQTVRCWGENTGSDTKNSTTAEVIAARR